MRVEPRCLAALAAEELPHGHPRALALEIPQRHVDAGQCVVEHRPAAPVRADVCRLKDVLDVIRVAPQQEWLEVLLNRGDDRQRPLGERSAAQAVQTWLAVSTLTTTRRM